MSIAVEEFLIFLRQKMANLRRAVNYLFSLYCSFNPKPTSPCISLPPSSIPSVALHEIGNSLAGAPAPRPPGS